MTFPFTPEQILQLVRHFPMCASFTAEVVAQAKQAERTGQVVDIEVEMDLDHVLHLAEHLVELANRSAPFPVYGLVEFEGSLLPVTPQPMFFIFN